MKKLKELKGIYNVFVDSINELDTKLQNQLKKVKQEYQKIVIEEKMRLLIAVCNDEGLDFNKIKGKYLKPKELNQFLENDVIVDKVIVEEDLLDKIEINGEEYYYEAKERGLVYDINSKQVGVFKNGNIVFN
jgi:flavin-dependent dehydrogenase